MNKDSKFIRKGKLLIMVFGLLSLVNIIILIGKNSSYALFRRNVQSKRVIEIHTASEFLPEIGVDALKKKLGTGGLIGIPTSCSEENCDPITDKNADKSTIREYRYSGLNVNNYVYFNCKEGVEQNSDNCETWRILGVFKDESGQEHLKIVNNQTLSGIPSSYTANGKTFNLSGGTTSRWDTDSGYDNNWGDAGLMNWLNSTGTEDGYFKTLSEIAQGMIEETKYYLGTGTYDETYIMKDTPVEAYNYERAVIGCTENKGPGENSSRSAVERNSSCRVWANNAATWTGKIALMYPSDYGYTVDSSYWTNTMISSKGFTSTVLETSWLYKEANHSNHEWFLSPSSYTDSHRVASWHAPGFVHLFRTDGIIAVRPSLYLKSSTQIIGGNGSSSQPYKLNYRAVDALKEKLGIDGLVGVTEDNTTTISKKDEVREYRYSGLGVNNYVKFNNELWRIIGIFKDEKGQEHVKIVRNEVLKKEVFPITYETNETIYKIKNENDNSNNLGYWNMTTEGLHSTNWAEAGLMNWLNSKGTTDGYLKTLTNESQEMIAETKYYLGTLTWDPTYNISETPIEAYNHERAITGCTENKGPSENKNKNTLEGNSNCRVWANNAATWNGKIGLIYPSDYGFSTIDSYWNTIMGWASFNVSASNNSWLQKESNRTFNEWFISPYSSSPVTAITGWLPNGTIYNGDTSGALSVRPSLYLKSKVEIIGGDGTFEQPYQLK